MESYLRLRQICLVAPELAPAEQAITNVLGLTVCYRDPAVAKYGLENALWPVGDMFLEVVAPTRAETAAGRFLERSGGRGGYMVIFDCSDPKRRAEHARTIGVRVIVEHAHGAYTGVQLHPRDCRAAMIEFNHTTGGDADATLYAPAGPDWQRARNNGVTRAIKAIELASPDPNALAAHWAEIIEVTNKSGRLCFPEADLSFVASDDGGERLSALQIVVPDVADMKRRAEHSGLASTERGFMAAGVEWVPVQG